MAKSVNQKLKLLYLLRILTEQSDEQHPVSTAKLIDKLSGYDISVERKTIYDDMNQLIDFGYDIIQVKSRVKGGYYLASREFELAELKLLVDAVSSSRFITLKKSRELIGKLEKLSNHYDAKQLQRQVYVVGRVKTDNEAIYYNVDTIYKAIDENVQIRFRYMEWNLKKEMVARKAGKLYEVSPWALIWEDENYYLLAFDGETDSFKHYRVDKMGKVALSTLKRQGSKEFDRINMAEYTKRTFGMFGGEEETVSLCFSNRLIGVVLDRFGKEADIRTLNDEYIQVRLKAQVSGQFFGWLCGLGEEAVILGPKDVKSQYTSWLHKVLEAQKR